MSFEQEINEKRLAVRMNILKSFSDFDEDSLYKSEDDDLEKAKKFDSSTQRNYADNAQNQKLGRAGQTFGGRNIEESDGNGQKKTEDNSDSGMENKSEVPTEKQPTNGQHSDEDLQGFATEAEDFQLQEFIDDANASGDTSDYMMSQINIAKQELSNRGNNSNENEGSDSDMNGDNEEGDMNGDSEEGTDDGSINYSDPESVKNFLNANPDSKQQVVDMMMDDIFLDVSTALKLQQAQTQSSSDALQHVQAAKDTLDELHAKLGGTSDDNSEDKEVANISDYKVGGNYKFYDDEVGEINGKIENIEGDNYQIKFDGDFGSTTVDKEWLEYSLSKLGGTNSEGDSQFSNMSDNEEEDDTTAIKRYQDSHAENHKKSVSAIESGDDNAYKEAEKNKKSDQEAIEKINSKNNKNQNPKDDNLSENTEMKDDSELDAYFNNEERQKILKDPSKSFEEIFEYDMKNSPDLNILNEIKGKKSDYRKSEAIKEAKTRGIYADGVKKTK
jgi:hypothetical protein